MWLYVQNSIQLSLQNVRLTKLQIPPMRPTTKEQRKQSRKVSHQDIPKKALASGFTQEEPGFCVGKQCVTTKSSASGLIQSTMTGPL